LIELKQNQLVAAFSCIYDDSFFSLRNWWVVHWDCKNYSAPAVSFS